MRGKYCPPVAITLETNNGVIQSQEKHVAKEGMAWHGLLLFWTFFVASFLAGF